MVKLRKSKKEEGWSPPSTTDAAPAAAEPAPAPEPATAVMSPPPSYSPGRAGGSTGRGGLFERMYGSVGEDSASDRERVARADFEQAIAPTLDYLHASVPEASSPDEAARIIDQQFAQVELVPDPKGGAYVYGDAFENDARVYYRLLRRDYEKNPRPSESRKKSHHLHEVYGKLVGTKGW